MSRYQTHIGKGFLLILIAGSFYWYTNLCFAESFSTSQFEASLLARINQARQNPLQTAEEVGLDPEVILTDFPEIRILLKNGLQPLQPDEKLFYTARAHTEDMLNRRYYDSTTLEGETFVDRMRQAGILSLVLGESLGFVGFQNFVPPENAVDFIFRKMFIDELNPERQTERNILNPKMASVGIGIGGGVLDVDGQTTNVYLATVDFSSGLTGWQAVEEEFLQLVNRYRADPALFLRENGYVLKDTEFENLAWWGIQPLSRNPKLDRATHKHTADMIDRLYYDSRSPEGLGPEDRAASEGYSAIQIDEVLSALIIDSQRRPEEVAEELFDSVLTPSLERPDNEYWMLLQDPNFSEIGISVTPAFIDLGNENRSLVGVLGADFAEPQDPVHYLIGKVHYASGKDAMAAGKNRCSDSVGGSREGISNIVVKILPLGTKEDEVLSSTVTKAGGYFQVNLSGAMVNVKFEDLNGNLLKDEYLFFTGENIFKEVWICR